jgi:hypothetical protein
MCAYLFRQGGKNANVLDRASDLKIREKRRGESNHKLVGLKLGKLFLI